MKRETLAWLRWQATDTDQFGHGAEARDALATDAEVKRLRAELRRIDRMIKTHRSGQMPTPAVTVLNFARNMIDAALKPQVTRERKRR